MSAGLARRIWRGSVVVCAALGVGAAVLVSSSTPVANARTAPRASAPPAVEAKPKRVLTVPSEPVMLAGDKRTPSVVVTPPAHSDAPQPLTVMLHGMCDEPQYECPWFAEAATPRGWLVCPQANVRCEGGGSTWSGGAKFEQSVEGSIARVEHEYPETVDDAAGRTVIGFSLGGTRAVELALNGHGKYKYVIAIAANVSPTAKQLRAAGVARVLYAAGDYDMMKGRMQSAAKRLARQGFPVAFMSTGKVGHTFPRDLPARMQKALAWVHGDDGAFVPSERGEIAFVPAAGTSYTASR